MLIMNDFVKEVDEQMLGIQNKNSSYFVEWWAFLVMSSFEMIVQDSEQYQDCGVRHPSQRP